MTKAGPPMHNIDPLFWGLLGTRFILSQIGVGKVIHTQQAFSDRGLVLTWFTAYIDWRRLPI